MTRINRRGLALLALFLGAAINTASEAAVTRTPYQKYIPQNCPTGNLCLINFPAVPANVRLEITSVSCYVEAESTPIFTAMDVIQVLTVNSDGTITSAVTLVPQQVGYRNPAVSFAANDTVSIFASATQHFQFYARSHTGQMVLLACSIGGERVRFS